MAIRKILNKTHICLLFIYQKKYLCYFYSSSSLFKMNSLMAVSTRVHLAPLVHVTNMRGELISFLVSAGLLRVFTEGMLEKEKNLLFKLFIITLIFATG